MVGNSKVLTVSYGTFSCTLEGFDDSFDTMKAIAEYFRDLAAEDRYFGAEPPQPDAEVLARIAERELARGVQARAEGHTVLLKPSPAPAAAPAAEAPAEPPAETYVETHAETPVEAPAEALAPAPVDVTEPVEAPVEEVAETVEATDVVAEETQITDEATELEAETVAEDDAEEIVEEAVAETDDTAEDMAAEDASDDDGIEAEAEAEAEAEDIIDAAEDEIADEDVVAQEPAEPEAIAEDAEDETDISDEADAPVAEIEDVVSEAEEDEAEAVEAIKDHVLEAEVEDETFAEDAEAAEEAAEVAFDAVEDAAEAEDEAATGTREDTLAADVARALAANTVDDAPSQAAEAEQTVAEDVPAEEVPAERDDSLAAKLRRIQAVVSSSAIGAGVAALTSRGKSNAPTEDETTDYAEPEYTEDEHAEDISGELEAETSLLETMSVEDDVAELEADAEREAEAEIAADEAIEGGDEDAAETAAEPEQPRVLKMKRADFEAALARANQPIAEAQAPVEDAVVSDEAAEDAPETQALATEAELDDIDPEEKIESSLSDEDEADLMAELAAAEADAAADTDQPSEADVIPEAEIVGENAPEDIESHDFDAEDFSSDDLSTDEVAAEKADSENTDGDERDGGPVSLVAEDEDDTVAAGEGSAAENVFADSEETMGRLMDVTEERLGDPDNKGRRDAYSALKAAVAAKQAARTMGEDEPASDAVREGDYRADLAQVVRPRRAPTAQPSERTKRPAPAPLKLVASQRVDLTEDEVRPADPVRPRRISADQANAPTLGSAFEAFAAQAGAEELGDVLEAAAAYLTHVDGLDVFSRPQVMRIVQQAMPQGSFTREDGLRAFGTLLRQGRLHKVRGGQFEVTDSTRFQPEAREMRAAV